ncbi:DUF998 domain-containing protein [Mycobacterium sp. E2238]|uniref:DUF998 domain-containing protein n=1 Tax=Mycobacterium sp. E2238 TaxID=1834131 RepID=UPI0007FEF9CC|nr:DUF998 domain-containing protein [Mycobacterium sp. E2238]OBI26097.1 hypothetical protein A5711_05495 [Mycobacterium sp. E2238]
MSVGGRLPRARSVQLLCGALAGPLFVTAFTAIGAARRGYDWRRYPVSSLAVGRQGWDQRINFILAGLLYSCAAAGLARCDRRRIGPRAVPAVVAGAGIGLIGSGVFVTDYVGDRLGELSAPARRTRAGRMHDLCGIPVFAGIPVAGLASAATAVRTGDYRWACYSAGSSTVMAGTLLLLGAAIKGRFGLSGKSGIFQRISIIVGLGWLSSVSLRGLGE